MKLKAKLGAPKLFQSFVRNHVWETKFWTMYISSEGISLEVEEALTPDQAHYVWKDWFNMMCEAVGEPERKI
jgi:hypothetical protein